MPDPINVLVTGPNPKTDHGAAGDGSTDDQAALASSDDAALAASLPLMLPIGTYNVSSNLTIDSPVWFTPGSVLKPDDGITVTLAGGIVNAPMSQIFDASAGGNVLPVKVPTLYPQWWGAIGDGETDDTAAIQGALDVAGGCAVKFTAGSNWLVDADPTTGGLVPTSDTRIVIEEGATVEVKTNDLDTYRLFRIDGVDNVILEGAGTLLGDLDTHSGSTGEYGHLVFITNGASNIQVLGPLTLKKAWGDGIYIGGTSQCENVTVDGVTVEDCRREGIAPFWVDGCTVRNCTVRDIGLTDATSPASGIDCEPNEGEAVNNLTLENNHVENCAGCGIYASANPGTVTNLVLRDNQVHDCGLSEESLTTYQYNGIHIAAMTAPVLIDNVVSGCGYDDATNGLSGDIYLRAVTGATVQGGRLSEGLGRGLYVTGCTNTNVDGVTIEDNQYHAVYVYDSDGTVLQGNKFLDNVAVDNAAVEHVIVQSSHDCLVQGNTFRGANGHSWVRIRTSGNDNLISNNVGQGAGPANIFGDDGARTIWTNNVRKGTGVFTSWTASDPATSSAALQSADLLGWTFDPATALSSTILPAAETVYLCRIPVRAPITVTNIVVSLSTLGDTLTHSYLGLFKSDGTVLGQTADQSSAWGGAGSTGVKTVALTAPVLVVPTAANDFVWAAFYVGTASALPTFARGTASQSSLLNTGLGARKRFASSALSDTATLTSVTPASLNVASHAYWMALS